MSVPDQAHRDLAVDPARSVLLQAPAGSGKTAVLLLRYLRCLAVVEQPEQVLAISFTNKAAAEIRQRVIAALRQPPQGEAAWEQSLNQAVQAVLARDHQQGWRLLDHPGRLRIQTFDSFCISLARRRPLLAGAGALNPSSDPSALYRDAALSLFSELDKPDVDPDLADALAALLSYASNRIEQLVPLLGNLLAKREQWMPGLLGGDTDAVAEVLADRLEARWQQTLDKLSQFDFSELTQALAAASPGQEVLAWAADADFGYGYWRQLANFLLTGGQSSKRNLRKKVDKRLGFDTKSPYKAPVQEWLKAHQDCGIEPHLQVLAELPDPELPEEVARLCERFRVALLQLLGHLRLQFEMSGEMDFTEIGFAAIAALRWGEAGLEEGLDEGPGEALLAEDRIQHVLVDEMQDTSVNQIRLLTDLVKHWQPDEGRSLFFCGDLMQSIYRFRGALVGLFHNLVIADEFAGQPLEKLRLTANFRSSPTVVDWVNQQFEPLINAGQGFVRAQPQKSELGEVACHRLMQQSDKQARSAEAHKALSLIQSFLATEEDGDLAVLVRSRSHLNELIPMLRANEIAFSSQNIDRLSSSAPVQDYLALLRVLSHPADRLSWAVLLRAACVGMSWADVDVLMRVGTDPARALYEGEPPQVLTEDGRQRWLHLAAALRSVRDSRWRAHAPRAAQRIWQALRGHELLDAAQAVDIQRLQALVEEQAPQGVIRDYRALQVALEALYATPQVARVHLMTIHGAKGLEFDWVISLGLNRQTAATRAELIDWLRLDDSVDAPTLLTPKSLPDSDEAVERLHRYVLNEQREAEQQESLRLLYVCVTRAVKQLHLIAGVEDEDAQPRQNSMAALLWPAFQTQAIDQPELQISVMDEPYVPTSPVIATGDLLVAELSDEAELAEDEALDEDSADDDFDENIRQRAMGLVYHEWMQWWASCLMQDPNWSLPDAQTRRRRLQARLRHHCLPEAELSAVTDEVNQLIDKTAACEQGRWLLQPRAKSGCEQALLAEADDSLRRLIVDRWFVEDSDAGACAWIIDYKTAQAGGDLDDFVLAQVERYRQKVEEYRKGLLVTGIAVEVRCALYFPFHQRLVEIL